MICGNCRTENRDGVSFCSNCGAPLNNVGTPPVQSGYNNQAYHNAGYTPEYRTTVSEGMIPEEYKPISMWGYFGYQLLFSIPCIGQILLIIFALGGTRNINLKNYARSFFCYLIIVTILFIIIFAMFGGTYASLL